MSILGERWILDKKGASRQYHLLYSVYKLPKDSQWRDADAQDRVDMPPHVLAEWRATTPAASVAWVRGVGVTKAQVSAAAKVKYVSNLT